MELNARESTLLTAFRRLPEETAGELAALTQRLAELAPHTTIDWSDAWSEEDLREFTAHSLRRVEEDELP